MSRLLIEYPMHRPRARTASMERGADGVLRYGDLTPALTELLDLRVHSFATREAVVEVGGPRLTYRQLWHSASRIAGGLRERGIGYGDRVAVRMPSGARWVRAFLGALLSGAVPVLVNDGLPDDVAERVLADSDTDFVLGCGGEPEFPDGPAFIDDGAALGELALLCYTRGPAPRGVELTNENLLSAISAMVSAAELPTDGLRNLVLGPLAHASGCVEQLLSTFAVGGTVVLAGDAGEFAEALRSERIDTVSGTRHSYVGLLPELATFRAEGLRTDGVRRISTAAERAGGMPGEVVAELAELFPSARQWSVWGATETAGVGLAVDHTAGAADEIGAVLGFAFGGTELALSGPLAESGHGELLCRGPSVMSRYWNDPKGTRARFTGCWFHTGDQVSIDADGLVRRE
ncbi:class I adenylate-forming enzyme family protein [Nocardia callitridis]|uniref:AMP-dependent synthetase/ligase domain-containing protein n=1 Tax=Nocardia callitridis TaxID=648753 RepID=A0ABP9JQV1_9NOCA